MREKDDLRTTVTGRVLEDVFPVLDTLALAIGAAKQPNADLKSLVGGIDLVLAQLRGALANHGLKEINPDLVGYMMSGNWDPYSEEDLLAWGATGLIKKPFSFKELAPIVHSHCVAS